jgi:hypothetical protein
LTHDQSDEVIGLDDVTTYYLLHRRDFAFNEAPSGACILYAVSCGLSDTALTEQYDILVRSGAEQTPDSADDADVEDTSDVEDESGSGATFRLKAWDRRRRKSLGYETPGSLSVPLIDQVHRLMQLWRMGEQHEVDEYLDSRGLRRNELFRHLLQTLIEFSAIGSEERSILESISNHIASRGALALEVQGHLSEPAAVGVGED